MVSPMVTKVCRECAQDFEVERRATRRVICSNPECQRAVIERRKAGLTHRYMSGGRRPEPTRDARVFVDAKAQADAKREDL